ncbi:carbon storage regulator CsrA [Paenibacillus senegalimassiliensis]|uniref:carbon storage regulator CsrA n=1 Tax=Paenibacillus senegalimassiliensis TaxID=1737426 RepID=UPI00073F80D7|nr:carbon storage regulator CsrA [Paenibacillus senegalimassiliensis]
MLVLRRKVGEVVMIGNDIQVQVLGVEGDQIKLGFLAPKEVQLLRKELYEGVVAENMAANVPVQGLQQEQLLSLLKKFNK